MEYGDKGRIEGLDLAIKRADTFFNVYGIPTCDYKIFQNHRDNFVDSEKGFVRDSMIRGFTRFRMLMKMNPFSYNTFELLIHNSLQKANEYEEKKKEMDELTKT